MNTKKLG